MPFHWLGRHFRASSRINSYRVHTRTLSRRDFYRTSTRERFSAGTFTIRTRVDAYSSELLPYEHVPPIIIFFQYSTAGETQLVCPIRWDRSSACLSLYGLKSISCIMTVSADVRLIPNPPALVDSRNMNISGSVLNVSINSCLRTVGWFQYSVTTVTIHSGAAHAAYLSAVCVCPSNRKHPYSLILQNSVRISNMWMNWLKMRTRWPPSLNDCSIGVSVSNLPDCRKRSSSIL